MRRLLAMPRIDVGIDGDGQGGRVPHRDALRGAPARFVLALVAAVGDVLLINIEKTAALQVVEVAVRVGGELVARLDHFGEPERFEARGEVVNVC